MIDNKRIGYHYTHNDGDAVGCALVASLALSNTDFTNLGRTVFNAIGDANDRIIDMIEEIERYNWNHITIPDMIVISDISLTKLVCDRLTKFVKDAKENAGKDIELIGIDHHETNHLDDSYEWWFVKTHKDGIMISAAEIMFDMWADVNAPEDSFLMKIRNHGFRTVIKMISRYDTWEWKKNPIDSNDITIPWFPEDMVSTYCKCVGPEKCFLDIVEHYTSNDGEPATYLPDSIYNYYNIVQKKKDEALKFIPGKLRFRVEREYVIAMVINENEFSNDICDFVYNTYPFVDIVEVIYVSSKALGFRTKRTDINLGRYAERLYNGGGHQQASGAKKLSDEKMIEIMTKFYNGRTLDNIVPYLNELFPSMNMSEYE